MGGQGTEMPGDAIAIRLAALGHCVAHEDPDGPRARHRLGHARDNEGGEEARVETSGTQDHRVGRVQCLEHSRRRGRVGRIDPDALDRRATPRDLGLASNRAAIQKVGDQVNPVRGRRQDEIVHAEQLGRQPDRRHLIGRNHVERRQEKVPDRVLSCASVEPILKRRRHLRSHPRQRDQAVADVSGREDPILLSQDPRAPAVVCGRHDRGDPAACGEVATQPGEDNGQPGTAAQGDDHHGFLQARRHRAPRDDPTCAW